MSVLVVSLALLCVVFAVWSRLRRRPNAPPELPGALPILGHSLHVLGDRKHLWNFIRRIQNYSLEKNGVIEWWVANQSLYVITDPEDSLTVANSCLSKPFIYDFAKEYINNGLITAEESIWKSHRKLLNPSFNQQVLNTYVTEMNVQARSLVSRLASKAGKGPFDVRKFVINYTLSTVTRTSLGLNTHDQTTIDTEYADAIEDLFALYCDRFQKVWLHLSFIFNWSAMKRKQTILLKKLKNIIDPVILKRKSELKANNDPNMDDNSTPGKFKPVLDQMLQLTKDQDAFTDSDIREHLDTFVAAAYDTTSSALTFILLVIGSDQNMQERIFKELKDVLEHEDDDLTKQDLPKLVYLEAVIKEAMRMYPSVPLIGRKVTKDITLKNCTIRADSTCLIGVYCLLRHPMWGPDAEQFKPERWLNSVNLPDHPSLNAAFGVGKRNCIGKLYGMMVMKVALAHILRRYHVTGDINKVVCEFDVVLKPVEGNYITLALRLQEVLQHKDGDLTKHELPKLVYMEAVIKESLRLYPSVPFFGRKITKDIDLKNCTLRAGSTCFLGVYGLLRHPMWGPDAEQFRPERWLDSATLPDHPTIHAGFGIGKRNCIGKVYATMGIKVALAHILRRYQIQSDISNLVCEFDVVLKPVEGHLIDLTLRT